MGSLISYATKEKPVFCQALQVYLQRTTLVAGYALFWLMHSPAYPFNFIG